MAGYQGQGIRDRGSGAGDQEQGIRGSGAGDQGQGIRGRGSGDQGQGIGGRVIGSRGFQGGRGEILGGGR